MVGRTKYVVVHSIKGKVGEVTYPTRAAAKEAASAQKGRGRFFVMTVKQYNDQLPKVRAYRRKAMVESWKRRKKK